MTEQTLPGIADIISLSPMQQGMLFHTLLAPDSGVYVEQVSCEIEDCDTDAFRQAWDQVIARHEALRSAFVWESIDKPVQAVYESVEAPWKIEDWRSLDESEQKRRFEDYLAAERSRGFQVDIAPLMRFALFRASEARYRFVWTHHHLLLDGWSLRLIFREILICYEAAIRGEQPALPPIRAYHTFIDWIERQNRNRAANFWKSQLKDLSEEAFSSGLNLSPPGKGCSSEYRRLFSAPFTARLERLARSLHVTLNTLLQGVWALLLSRYSGHRNVVFGSTVSVRPPEIHGVESMAGLFINTIPVSISVTPGQTLSSWLNDIQALFAAAEAHAWYPLQEIQACAGLPGGVSLFDSLLVFENTPTESRANAAAPFQIEQFHSTFRTNYPITLVAGIHQGQLQLSANIDSTRDDTMAAWLVGQIETALEAVSADGTVRVGDLGLLTSVEAETQRRWNETGRSYPQRGLAELFSETVSSYGEQTAAIFAGQRLTYVELNKRANRLAWHLRDQGVGAESLVGLSVAEGLDAVVSMLAVVKAGGAYVPLRSEDPRRGEIVQRLCRDQGMRWLLVSGKKPALEGVQVISLAGDAEALGRQSEADPPLGAAMDQLAYVIHTSGSTGIPKGIAVTQAGVVRLVRESDYLEVWPGIRMGQISTYTFDAATFEVWGALLNGGCLVEVPGEVRLWPRRLAEWLREEQIDAMFLTAALFNQVVSEVPAAFNSMHTLLVGGEALTAARVREVLEAGGPRRLLNGYGPTECTTFALWHPLGLADTEGSVPIGRPLANTEAWVLGAHLERQPVGVLGEIGLAGPGLARCYLGDARKTAERFVPHPCARVAGERLYLTGDWGRWRGDGVVEYAGRRDGQIKLRGFRIEPGEIEAALKAHRGVRDAAVALRAGKLCAWTAVEPGLTADQLRRHLESRLPSYMLPAAIATLPSLPLNHNGKIDRQALPEIAFEETQESATSGNDAILEIVRAIFAEVLGIPSVGGESNFFELGGHSLTATQLISRLRDALSVEAELRAFFQNPTPHGVAELVRQARGTGTSALAPPLERNESGAERVLSFAQERLWFLNQLEPESPFYNTPGILRLEGNLNKEALSLALREIVSRHEVFRTRYENRGGKPIAVVDGASPADVMRETDLSALPREERELEAKRVASAEVKQPFQLSTGPVFRFHLLCLNEREHILIVVMHHIISDGWSLGVLIREAAEFYRAFATVRQPALDPLPVRYSDFALWQRTWLQGTELERQGEYWTKALAGAPPALDLPTDRPRPREQSFRGNTVRFEISASTSESITKLARHHGATPFMALLAAFAVLLHRFSRQSDIVIGSPIANRNLTGIEGLIGFFVNTLPLRINLEGEPSFEELLRRVRDISLEAFDRQDIPFERLIEDLQLERDLSRNPLFQVMFTMQNAPVHDIALPKLKISPILPDQPSALFDLSLDMWQVENSLHGALEYATDLFDEETANRMAGCFIRLLESIAQDASAPISAISLLTAAERRKVLALGNGGSQPYPVQSIAELFEQQARTASERIAALHNGKSLTYAQLNTRANRIANWLRAREASPNALVGILVERGLDYACSLLGILKAGAAFVPFDPAYPAERLRYMLEDSGVRWLIAGNSQLARFALDGSSQLHSVLCFDTCDRRQDDVEIVAFDSLFDDRDPEPVNSPEDTAYGMYTSGSTGLPKAALVRHNGAVNHIFAEALELSLDSNLVFLQSAPVSSDISVWQYLAPWLLGGRTHIVDAAVVSDGARLFESLRDSAITLIELVPAVLNELLYYASSLPPASRTLPALQCAMVTGELAPVTLINRWLEIYPQIPLVNAYGPTEAADDVCQARYAATLPAGAATSPIGRPLANLNLYVLDSRLRLVPIGVPGEICIAGVGVGKGYWKRDELTQAAFVSNPYPGFGRTLYRTGDLGRWQADGQMEFAGRIDQQVKIRGFRIETGEIESVLLNHPAVRDAVVTVAGPEDNRRLVAWLTPATENAEALPLTQLESEQVSLWKALHENSYGDATPSDPEFNTIGWDSNYTRAPFSEAEMREYVSHTVNRVLEHKPQRILEIGCGSGLLAYPLARACREYVGIDLSSVAIAQLAAETARRGLTNTRFICSEARTLDGIEGQFDAILLASVVQYFPGTDYFLDVIAKALERLRPGGMIHIADVRSLALLRAFHATVQMFQAPDELTAEELNNRVLAQLQQEQELAFDPMMFRCIAAKFPMVRYVDISPKRGRLDNELTCFRYDVTLYTGAVNTTRCEWQPSPDTIEEICALLAKQPESLALRRIPNARTAAAAKLVLLLNRTKPAVGITSLREIANEAGGIHPESLREAVRGIGYEVCLSQWESRADGAYDAVFRRLDSASRPHFFDQLEGVPPLTTLVNNPLREKLQSVLATILREFLKKRLPEHMVPSQFVVLDAMPLGPGGKVDRRSLNAPEEHFSGREYAAPANEIERKLIGIWAQVLEIAPETIGVNDNFFSLGGHSLKATRIASLAQGEFGVAMPVREIFGSPTVAELARALPRLARGGIEPIPPAPPATHYPLSPAQRAIWTHAQISPAPGIYNMTSARLITGDLDVGALQDAFAAVIERHESLRTAIVEFNGEPVQQVLPRSPAQIEFIPAPGGESPSAAAREIIERESLRPLNQANGECIRAVLIQLAHKQHLLFTVVSHLVFDGVSEVIFMRDLTSAYEQRVTGAPCALLPLEIQFKDYAVWRAGQKSSADYWMSTLTPLPPVLDLPCDRPRPDFRTHRGDVATMDFGPELSQQLRGFAQQSGSSVYSVLVSGVAALLNRYSGQTDMILGEPTDGRAHPDLDGQIGCFVNVLPLRARVSPDETFSALHARIASALAEALDHRNYDLTELLARGLPMPHFPGRLPLIEAVVSLQVAEESPRASHRLQIQEFAYELPVSQFDVGFYFTETRAGLRLELRYDTDLFDRGAMAKMAFRFAGLLTRALAESSQPFCDLRIEDAPPLPDFGIGDCDSVSPHQGRLWFIDQFETGRIFTSQPTYHVVPLLIRFAKPVDVTALGAAIRAVVAQYGELRARVLTRDGKPVRGQALSTAVPLERSEGDYTEALAFAQQPLALDSSPAIRAGVFAGDTLLAVGLHHAFVDPSSVSKIGAAIRAQYEAGDSGQCTLSAETVTGAEFAAWQHDALEGDATEAHRFYWRARLRGFEAPLRLPEDHPRSAVHIYDGAALASAPDPTMDHAVTALAHACGIPESVAVMAAFAALLIHYSQQQRMILGWMHPNRDACTENTIGALANLLPICLQADPQLGFARFAAHLAARMSEAEEMRAIPFERLVESVGPQVDLSRTALFDVLYRYEHVGDSELVPGFGYGKYDLQLCTVRRPSRIEFLLVYNAALFERCTMERMMRHFHALLIDAAHDPGRAIGKLSILDAGDLDQELNAWNPQAELPRTGNIVSIFEAQAIRHGEREAVVMGTARLSYQQLNIRANRLAHYLLARGVQPEQLIGICLERTPDLIVVLLAILKAGAAYLPISPDLPPDRIAFMAADSGLQYWIGSRATAGQVPPGLSTVILDRDAASIDSCPATNPDVALSDNHLAYCIYTSGSTGKPKGVLVEHRNVVRLLFNYELPFEFSEQDVWTMFHAASFDFSVWEVFGALLNGGKLVMVPRTTALDPEVFASLLARENVTVLNQTPGAFYQLIPATANYPNLPLRYLIFGGEALQPIQLRDFYRRYPAVRIVNMYGITETTVHVTFKAITEVEIESNTASVGLPLPGATLYLMDDRQRLLPPGAPGEIYVGGVGVSRGYLNRPELTAQRFVTNSFRPTERLYRSGDRGRRLANGEVLYLGRIDNQVQVRGYRIELGEIEEALASYPGIQQAAAIAFMQGGTHRVAAYYAPQSGMAPEPEQVRAHLRSRLPEYMLPADLIPLGRLPITANGKIDRAALPALETVRVTGAQELLAPANELEEQISAIWRKVLGRETIGVNQNFFDAGGDSFRLVQVRAGLRETLGLDVSIADLFRYPTIYDLAQHLGDVNEDPGALKLEADDRAATRRAARARRAAKR